MPHKYDAFKYILIPEYAPLYAMKKCFGPTQGPLTRPNLTPVDIIGELLLQSGNEKVTIYEVIEKGTGFSKPALLNLDNYKLPYNEIVGITDEEVANTIISDVKPSNKVVEPVIKVKSDVSAATAEQIVDEIKNIDIDELSSTAEITMDNTSTDEVEEDVVPEDTVEEAADTEEVEEEKENAEYQEAREEMLEEQSEPTGINVNDIMEEATAPVVDPYAGMTKAERKAARRAAAIAAAEENKPAE